MADPRTLFDLPIAPEEFGVLLPPAELRRLDFSALDYTTARRAIVEYIRTYFPDDFNDFVASNGMMMLVEIVAAEVHKLSLRSDLLANEAFIGTAKTERAIINHLALINQRIKGQTPAIVDMELSVEQPVYSDIEIDPGLIFNTRGSDQTNVSYEVYRAPNDWDSKIVIPAGKRGVIAWGVEGNFASPVSVVSAGGPNQQFTISESNILESPLFATITLGDETEDWRVVLEPIERYSANDKVVEALFFTNSVVFRFGDDRTGKAPLSGSIITFRFRTGGGIRGRIGVGQIDSTRSVIPLPPANSSVPVRFRNVSPSSGGTDRESIAEAKKRAPREYSLQRSIVTSEDYAIAASLFSHPVYGSVSKALATVRTSLNANRVEIYVLAEGPDGKPVVPSVGLKSGLETYFSDLNVLTDEVVALDGKLKPVDIDMNIVISKNSDASVIKEQVESAINDYFQISNWDMGEPFYVSNFIELIESIDGIAYVDLFKPANNILPFDETLAGTEGDFIAFNEIIVEGERKTNYYYETTSSLNKR